MDPATNEVARSANLGATNLCSGIGTSYDAVWTCVGSDVLRLDPETLEVVARLAVQKQAVQGHLVGGFDSVWVRNGMDFLIRLDRETGERRQQITAEDLTSGGDLVVLDGEVWTTAYDDQLLLRIDP